MLLWHPFLQVCRGDTIVVDVKNKIVDRVVTIHWHGVYQRHTPHSDGVPLLTQCPIIPETTYRYKFPAMPYGTFFYHSHIGELRWSRKRRLFGGQK